MKRTLCQGASKDKARFSVSAAQIIYDENVEKGKAFQNPYLRQYSRSSSKNCSDPFGSTMDVGILASVIAMEELGW